MFIVLGTEWITGDLLYWTIFLIALSMVICLGFPYLTTFVPGALVAIVVVTAVEHIFTIGTRTVGDQAPIVVGSFPTFYLPVIALDTWRNWEARSSYLAEVAPYHRLLDPSSLQRDPRARRTL